MDIGSLIAGKEVAAAAGAAGLAAAGALGRWLYRRAKARQAKRDASKAGRVPLWLALAVLVPVVSGCATWDSAVIGIGDALGGGREPVAPSAVVPAGYEIVWDVYDANNVRQDLTGWYRVPRIVAQEGTPRTPLVIDAGWERPEELDAERPEQDSGPTGGGPTGGEAFEALVERVETLLEQMP